MLFKESFRVIWSIMSLKCLPSCAMHSWSRKNDWRIFYPTTQIEQLWLGQNVLSTGQGNWTPQEYPCRLYAPCYQCMWYHVLEIFLRSPFTCWTSCNVICFVASWNQGSARTNTATFRSLKASIQKIIASITINMLERDAELKEPTQRLRPKKSHLVKINFSKCT